MKILVIGSGGREHCLAWKISQSPKVDKIYCAPGNAGTELIAQNIDIAADDIMQLLKFALREKIDLTIVGPEVPLVAGIVDCFYDKGLRIFGPSGDLALLEGSKVFAKEMMKKFNIPTADFEVFVDAANAKEYIKSKSFPLVIKADGLAAGKGVIICQSLDEANLAIEEIMVEKKYGKAGDKIIIEDFVDGEEASVLVCTDGDEIVSLASSQDNKRAFDGDKGPNTGGMGAYSPAPSLSDSSLADIVENIFKPLINGLKDSGKVYRGVLYGGIMIKNGRPYVLEFNVRFGDPETQAILPKLKGDLVDFMVRVSDGNLKGFELQWDQRFCLCVVLASGGYPGVYEKGKVINGLDNLNNQNDVSIFHCGTKKDKSFITNGGRVLNVVSLADTVVEAQDKVYKAIKQISFDGMYYRKDIGDKAL